MLRLYSLCALVLMCVAISILPAGVASKEEKKVVIAAGVVGAPVASEAEKAAAPQLRYAHAILQHPALPNDVATLIYKMAKIRHGSIQKLLNIAAMHTTRSLLMVDF